MTYEPKERHEFIKWMYKKKKRKKQDKKTNRKIVLELKKKVGRNVARIARLDMKIDSFVASSNPWNRLIHNTARRSRISSSNFRVYLTRFTTYSKTFNKIHKSSFRDSVSSKTDFHFVVGLAAAGNRAGHVMTVMHVQMVMMMMVQMRRLCCSTAIGPLLLVEKPQSVVVAI